MPNKPDNYISLLTEIRSIIDKELGKAYQAIDNIRVQTYWQIGERIVREELKQKNRAEYGKQIVEHLAKDLGFSKRLIFKIIQFYKTYPIVQTVSAQLSWSHLTTLVRIKNPEQRKFYEIQSVKNTWSVRELRNRIKQQEYKKAKKSGTINTSPPKKLPAPQEIFKDTYNWNFLQLEPKHTEKELEKALTNNIRQTLLEFGYGFAFLGQQVKLLIASQYHTIDLLFYHRDLQCLIVIELKTEKFKDAHIGQMNKYLTYLKENDTNTWERDPIGLIVCKEKDHEEVHYALGKLKEDIFVAEYKSKLPREEEIVEKLRIRDQ